MHLYHEPKAPEVIQKFKDTKVGEIGISTITVSELSYGVAKSKFQQQNTKRLEEILPYNEEASKHYGFIRSQLEAQGNVIGPLDLLIAAHALSEKLVLVTNNEKEFNRIETIKVENWVK